MNVSLTRELEELIQEKVRSGRYQSASEVVREALRLLEEHDKIRQVRLRELKRDVTAGVRELDAGATVRFDRKAAQDIKKRGRAKLARGGK